MIIFVSFWIYKNGNFKLFNSRDLGRNLDMVWFHFLLQFPGNTNPDSSGDPECTASAGHSCHYRIYQKLWSLDILHMLVQSNSSGSVSKIPGGHAQIKSTNFLQSFLSKGDSFQVLHTSSRAHCLQAPLMGPENASLCLILQRIFLLIISDDCSISLRKNAPRWR